MSHVISQVTGPKFTNFLQAVGQFIALFTRPSALRYSIPFWNATASMPNEGHLQILAHGNVPLSYGKRGPDS